MTPKKLRMYEPLWEALKKHKSVTISAPPEKHKLIIRMVSKEKWQDTEFKKKEGWRMYWLSYEFSSQDPTQLTFYLNFKLSEMLPHEF